MYSMSAMSGKRLLSDVIPISNYLTQMGIKGVPQTPPRAPDLACSKFCFSGVEEGNKMELLFSSQVLVTMFPESFIRRTRSNLLTER